MKHWIVPLFTFSVALPATAQDDVRDALAVHFVSRTVQRLDKSERKAKEKELQNIAKQAGKVRKALEKQLKKQYGKKKDRWPEDVRDQYARADEAQNLAWLHVTYLNNKQKDLDDTVLDLERSVHGEGFARVQKSIRLVDSTDEATIAVEVLSRWSRGSKWTGAADVDYLLALKVTPGGNLDPAQLLNIAPKGGFFKDVQRLHRLSAEEPYWIIRVRAKARRGNAAYDAASAINSFIEDNYDVLSSGTAVASASP